MKEVENNTEDLRNDENDVSDKDENLEDSDETVCSICNSLWRDYTKKGNWCYAVFAMNIYAQCVCQNVPVGGVPP